MKNGMHIVNDLKEKPIEVLVEFGDKGKRKPHKFDRVGPGQPGAQIGRENRLPVLFENGDEEESEFKIYVKVDELPQHDGKSAIASAPSEGRRIMNDEFVFHHIEYSVNGSEVNIVAHYYLEGIGAGINHRKNHEDPTIFHPDKP